MVMFAYVKDGKVKFRNMKTDSCKFQIECFTSYFEVAILDDNWEFKFGGMDPEEAIMVANEMVAVVEKVRNPED